MALEGEEQLFALPAFQTFLTKDEQPVSVRLLKKGVKHVLSHQILYTDFYEVELPEDSCSFAGFTKIKREDLPDYAVPKLIHSFLEQF